MYMCPLIAGCCSGFIFFFQAEDGIRYLVRSRGLGDVYKRQAEGFEPRDHVALGESLGAIDIERGAKVAGARFYFLTGVGARLELALLNLAVARAVDAGFTPMITPTLVRPEIMRGAGFLDHHSDEVYYLPADDLYLTGTSEVALSGYHRDEIIDLADGPKRYAGWSACYRREAGSHGKDTRGIIRVHQFHNCLLYTSDAADERSSVDLGGRRIIKKKKTKQQDQRRIRM